MELAFTLAFFLAIIIFDLIPVIKSKIKKDIVLYSIILSVTFVLIVLKSLDIDLPGPSEFIENTIKSVFKIK